MRFSIPLLLLAACSSAPGEATVPSTPPVIAETPLGDDAGTDAGAPADAAPAAGPSKGCRVAPANVGATTTLSTTANGAARVFHLSVPRGLVLGQPAPLVFVLHGASDTNPAKMKEWFGVEGHVAGALVAYPQALPRTRKDGSGGLVTRWDLYGDDDTTFFDAMLEDLAAAYCVDRARVFVTGFSSGGNFSQQLACVRAKDVKGMAVVAGPGPYSDTCGGAVPAWMTHDTGDETLPVADARSSRDFWATQNGCGKASWAAVPDRPECQRNAACTSGQPLVYCESTGVGHGVPDYAAAAIGAFFTSLAK
jgi:polyhydroxybutyrate depolymerase